LPSDQSNLWNRGTYFFTLVGAADFNATAIQGERFQIGNNGGINGWVTRRQIFGRVLHVRR
jgi:hypothetical protein